MKPRRKPYDPLLRTQPWKVLAVFAPLERLLHRIETDGTVDVAGRQIIFREDGEGGWYDLPAAMCGVAEFHDIAARRYGIPADTAALWKLAAKLDAGSPVFESDIAAVRESIVECKRQALSLRVSQANDIIKTIQIAEHLEKAA